MRTSKHIDGLDGLRAVAIIGVVGYHMCPLYIPGGFLGVNLFFVLSGYLIALTTMRRPFSPLPFFQKRIRRIYPALLLVTGLTLCAARLLTPDILGGIRREIMSMFLGYDNWWQIQKNASYFTRITGTSPFTHIWSLAVELQFYALWPLLLWIYRKIETKNKKYASFFFPLLTFVSWLIMVLLYQPGGDPTRIYYGTDTRLCAFTAGSSLAVLQKEKPEEKPKWQRTMDVILFLGLLLLTFEMYLRCDGQNAFTYYGAMGISILASCGLIHLCSENRAIGRYTDNRFMKPLGQRSYEIYLIQYPVIYFVSRKLYALPGLIRIILILALTAGIAIWFHDVITWFDAWCDRRRKA